MKKPLRSRAGKRSGKDKPQMKTILGPAVMQGGFVKMMRTPEAMELLTNAPNAFRLAAVIALRCRWRDGFNTLGLAQGEALLGDCVQCGMTEKEYRTAKGKLQQWNFACFKRAVVGKRRGTIGRLLDTRLFDTSPPPQNLPKGGARAAQRRMKGEIRNIKEEGGKQHGKRHRLANFPNSPSDYLQSRFPAVVEEVYEFGRRWDCDVALCDRWLRYTNLNKWLIDGQPIRSWQAVLIAFRDNLAADLNSEVAEVPFGWTPEIEYPDDYLNAIEDCTTTSRP